MSAVPGLFILGLLTLLTWAQADVSPVLAVGAAGVLVVVALELLSTRLAPSVPGAIEPLWWWLTFLALAAGLGPPEAAAVAAVGFVVLLELAGRARRPGWAVVIPGVLAAGLVPSTTEQPWLTVAVLAAASVWALVRRLAPFEGRWASAALDLAAGILPAAAVLALGQATSMATALAVGAALVAFATVPATRPMLARGDQDRFWTRLWTAGLGLVSVASVVVWAILSADAAVAGSADLWLTAGSVLGLTLVTGLGPMSPSARPWVVVSLGSWAWFLGCAAAGVPDAIRGGVLAVAALAIVVAVHLTASVPREAASNAGLAGHVLAMVALPMAGAQWGLVLAMGLATAGWAVTALFGAQGRSPVGDLLGGLNGLLRLLPPALAVLGTPMTVVTGLDVWGPDAGVGDCRAGRDCAGICRGGAGPPPSGSRRCGAPLGFVPRRDRGGGLCAGGVGDGARTRLADHGRRDPPHRSPSAPHAVDCVGCAGAARRSRTRPMVHAVRLRAGGCPGQFRAHRGGRGDARRRLRMGPAARALGGPLAAQAGEPAPAGHPGCRRAGGRRDGRAGFGRRRHPRLAAPGLCQHAGHVFASPPRKPGGRWGGRLPGSLPC